jgi:hypothetical protein
MRSFCCRRTSSVAVDYVVANWRHQSYFTSDPGKFSHGTFPVQTSQTTTQDKEMVRNVSATESVTKMKNVRKGMNGICVKISLLFFA